MVICRKSSVLFRLRKSLPKMTQQFDFLAIKKKKLNERSFNNDFTLMHNLLVPCKEMLYVFTK